MIEVVISIMLLAAAVAAVMAALSTATALSAEHRRDATADTVLRSFAESVKSLEYEAGASAADAYSLAAAEDNGFVAVTGYTAEVSSVQCWVPADLTVTTADFASCSDDAGLQRLVLTVTLQATGETQSTTIFKRAS